MSDNIIYEITQMMSDKKSIDQDLNIAKEKVTSMFKDKYLSKINEAIDIQHQITELRPSKEVELLKAIKNFTPIQKQKKVDELIYNMMMLDTLSNIKEEIDTSKHQIFAMDYQNDKDDSIHEDGVYDKMEDCEEQEIYNNKNKNKNKNRITEMLLAITILNRNGY